ncbi:MAG: HIRAN domain-containing protein [Actinomycetota bacterium]|nr:HIRAN domain-containing protein [Actinomycetota bacterium]
MTENNKNNLTSVDKKMLDVLKALQKGADLPKPFGTEIYLFRTYIAGTQYYSAKDNIENIKEKDFLIFQREPENPHDSKAIAVMDLNSNKLGYIPRSENNVISNLMDAGKNIYGIITNKKCTEDYINIEIKVFMRDY